MKKKASVTLNICMFVFGIEVCAQTAQFQFPITITDNIGGTQQLFVGVDPIGTDGIDASLGEAERPPAPPAGVFDARFIGDDIGILIGNGLVRDYRQGTVDLMGTRIHELKYQLNTGATSVTFAWILPTWAVGRLETFGGGVINVTMIGTDDTTLNSPAPANRTLQLTITYIPPLPVQLVNFTGRVANQQGHVRLDWRTITETNNYGFFVQRSLINRDNYQTISELIPGHGTTLEAHDYSWIDVSAQGGIRYYRLKQVDLDGTITYCEPIRIECPTSVKEFAPAKFALRQNYPNPFNPTTEIMFSVGTYGHTSLRVYDMLGREVATLFDDIAEVGQYYKVRLDADGLASGVYIYRLQAAGFADLKKLVVLK